MSYITLKTSSLVLINGQSFKVDHAVFETVEQDKNTFLTISFSALIDRNRLRTLLLCFDVGKAAIDFDGTSYIGKITKLSYVDGQDYLVLADVTLRVKL